MNLLVFVGFDHFDPRNIPRFVWGSWQSQQLHGPSLNISLYPTDTYFISKRLTLSTGLICRSFGDGMIVPSRVVIVSFGLLASLAVRSPPWSKWNPWGVQRNGHAEKRWCSMDMADRIDAFISICFYMFLQNCTEHTMCTFILAFIIYYTHTYIYIVYCILAHNFKPVLVWASWFCMHLW